MSWWGTASEWIVTEPLPRARQARTGYPAKIPLAELRELYRRHRAGESLNALGREVWARAGHASPGAAAVSIGAQFRRMGWPTRPQRKASSLRQRTNPTGARARRHNIIRVKTPKAPVLP